MFGSRGIQAIIAEPSQSIVWTVLLSRFIPTVTGRPLLTEPFTSSSGLLLAAPSALKTAQGSVMFGPLIATETVFRPAAFSALRKFVRSNSCQALVVLVSVLLARTAVPVVGRLLYVIAPSTQLAGEE